MNMPTRSKSRQETKNPAASMRQSIENAKKLYILTEDNAFGKKKE